MIHRKWLGIAAVLLLASGFADGQAPTGKERGAAAREALKQLQDEIGTARKLLPDIRDKLTRDRLDLALTRAQLKATELEKELGALAAPARPVAMTQAEFDDFLKGFRAGSFDKDRLVFVQNFTKKNYFTSKQAADLLRGFSFDNDRVTAAITLHPRVVDPDNFHLALATFSFDSGRKAVREALKLK